MQPARYTRYAFQGQSGYILHNELALIRHSARMAPWGDSDVHLHAHCEEYYLLLYGAFWLLVGNALITLRPHEMLQVQPGVPHAILRGEGQIEHFGLRVPAPDDRRSVAAIPDELPAASAENQRELCGDWGCRVPLSEAHNQNCWLFGSGRAKFESRHMSFAFLDFPTQETATAGIGARHRLHLHQHSWEYYCVLQGRKTLQIEDQLVKIQAGEILEVPPHARHTLYDRQAPYRGFMLRVPIVPNDKIEFGAMP